MQSRVTMSAEKGVKNGPSAQCIKALVFNHNPDQSGLGLCDQYSWTNRTDAVRMCGTFACAVDSPKIHKLPLSSLTINIITSNSNIASLTFGN